MEGWVCFGLGEIVRERTSHDGPKNVKRRVERRAPGSPEVWRLRAAIIRPVPLDRRGLQTLHAVTTGPGRLPSK
jgi:hypothetical protein